MTPKINPQDYVFPGPRGGSRDARITRSGTDEWFLDLLENYSSARRRTTESSNKHTGKKKRQRLKIKGF